MYGCVFFMRLHQTVQGKLMAYMKQKNAERPQYTAAEVRFNKLRITRMKPQILFK